MTPQPPGERPVATVGGCDPTQLLTGLRLEGGASGLDLDDVEVDDGEIAAVSLDGGRVTRLTLSDVVARGVSLVEVDLSDGRAERVEVTGSRLAGCVVDGSTWEDVTMSDDKVLRLSARQTTLRRVTWRDCDLSGLDLTGARLDRVRFERCTLQGAEFAGATVKRAEFVDCDLAEVRSVSSLRGATVDASTLQTLAGVLAAAAGIGQFR